MDIALNWSAQNYRADWVISKGGFQLDAGLRSAVLVSLFTDRVAPPDYVPPAGSLQDRRGWWGDTYRKRPIGSLLWTLDRTSISGSATTLKNAKNICADALQWLIDDGVAASIAITTNWIGRGAIGIAVEITRPSGQTVPFSYEWVWRGA